jgi:anti-sigma B factor antagonist
MPPGDSRMFRRSSKNAAVQDTRLDSGECTVHIVRNDRQLTVVVAGRVSVDSSPDLRSALFALLGRSAAPVIVITLSAVTYLDMSGLATLLEALKAARERSVKLRMTGLSGEARNLAEIAQLDSIFRAWGSEVEFE